MRLGFAAALAFATLAAPALGQSAESRVEAFAELPYWPGYWVAEYTIGTTISGIAPAILEARERGDTSVLRNFMSLNGAQAPWNAEGQRRYAEVRAISRGRKADGWGYPMMMNAATPVQFTITPEEVVIANSYNEVRHIYTDGRAMPDELDMWPTVYGTSVGHWEGDTLVVETRQVSTPSDYFHGAPLFSEDAVYLERIRLEGERLVSEVTVIDPVTLSEPFTTQVSWLRDDGFDRMIQIDWDNDRTSFDGEYNTIEADVQGASSGLLPGESAVTIAAIDGVVAEGVGWEIAWSGPMTADGMATAPDGNLLFAQEQSNAIWKLWPDGRAFVELPYVLGAGAVSVDGDGNIWTVERGCTDPGLMGLACERPSRVIRLTPERTVIASAMADGSTLGRLNDLVADGRGGAFFTQGALWHAAADGAVRKVADADAFTNGVAISPDGGTLYVTDRTRLIAFDLDASGTWSNRRTFATLSRDSQGFGGDGMTVDAEGRLYVTGDAGIYVFSSQGTELGVIPVPRRAITLAFAGPDRRTLYVGAMGAVTPGGAAWETPEGVRNVAMTIYRLPMLATGTD